MPSKRRMRAIPESTPPNAEAGTKNLRHLDTSRPAVPVEVLNFTVRTFVDRPEAFYGQATTTHRGGRF